MCDHLYKLIILCIVSAAPALQQGHEGHRHVESWEAYHWLFLGGTLAVYLLAQYSPNTNPHAWARDEAEERMRRQGEGKEVLYGVNYAAIRYMREKGAISESEAQELEGGAIAAPYKAPVKQW